MSEFWGKDPVCFQMICDNPILTFDVIREERTNSTSENSSFLSAAWKYLIIKCDFVESQPSCLFPAPLSYCARGGSGQVIFECCFHLAD